MKAKRDYVIEQIVIIAVNKYSQLKGLEFQDLDEITDVFDYDEILDCVLKYYCSLGVPNYQVIKEFIRKFYTMTSKNIDEVLN